MQGTEYWNLKEGMETGWREEEDMHRGNNCYGKSGRGEKEEQKAE